ncbi:hypothetical protein IG631_08203 [Alternaria alternata]|nr:hypothetical protein IG631_08203 [Alternaria alternata]
MVHATKDQELQAAARPLTQGAAVNDRVNNSVGFHGNDIVISYRGGIIENTHNVHAAVVDASGNLIYTIGNHQRMTLARSSTKPIQTLAILETGAAERFNYDDADVALMCASHSSEP